MKKHLPLLIFIFGFALIFSAGTKALIKSKQSHQAVSTSKELQVKLPEVNWDEMQAPLHRLGERTNSYHSRFSLLQPSGLDLKNSPRLLHTFSSPSISSSSSRAPASIAPEALAELTGEAPAPPGVRAVRDFLHKHELSNPDESVKQAKLASKIDGPNSKLPGHYVGILESTVDGTKLKMSADIALGDTKKGVVAAMQGQFGMDTGAAQKFKFVTDLQQLQSGEPAGRGASIIRVSTTAYIQMYYLPKSDMWVGNYYSSAKTGSYQLTGTTRLARK